MRNLSWYVKKTMENKNLKSYRALAKELGISNVAVNAWMNQRAWPSEDHMVRLAEMCEVAPEIALAELAVWRSEGTRAANFWQVILENAKKSAALCVLAVIATMAIDKNANAANLYYQGLSYSLYYEKCDFSHSIDQLRERLERVERRLDIT